VPLPNEKLSVYPFPAKAEIRYHQPEADNWLKTKHKNASNLLFIYSLTVQSLDICFSRTTIVLPLRLSKEEQIARKR